MNVCFFTVTLKSFFKKNFKGIILERKGLVCFRKFLADDSYNNLKIPIIAKLLELEEDHSVL